MSGTSRLQEIPRETSSRASYGPKLAPDYSMSAPMKIGNMKHKHMSFGAENHLQMHNWR